MNSITYAMQGETTIATIDMPNAIRHQLWFDDYDGFYTWLKINKAESIEGG